MALVNPPKVSWGIDSILPIFLIKSNIEKLTWLLVSNRLVIDETLTGTQALQSAIPMLLLIAGFICLS